MSFTSEATSPSILAFHEAHVEAVERGVHTIVIEDGPDYTINRIHLPDGTQVDGPGAVNVHIKNLKKDLTVWIDVEVDFD